jgi:hypothetical protein
MGRVHTCPWIGGLVSSVTLAQKGRDQRLVEEGGLSERIEMAVTELGLGNRSAFRCLFRA